MEILFYLIHIPLFFWVAWWLWRRDQEHPLHRFYWSALTLKIMAAVLTGILYSGIFNTTGDTYAYMIDGRMLNEIMQTDFSAFSDLYFFSTSSVKKWQLIVQDEPRYWFLFRIIYPLNLLCGLQYYLLSAWITLFCFIQLYKLSGVILKHYTLSKTGVLLALLLIPSVVFWSAGLNKEPVAVAVIAYLVRIMLVYLKEGKKPSFLQWIITLFFITVLWQVKFYYAAILLPCLLMWYVLYQKGKFRWIFFSVSIVAMLLFFTMTNRHLSPDQFVYSLYQNYERTLEYSAPGSYFSLPRMQPDLYSIIKVFPQAVWYGSFTPQLWQAHYVLAYVAALQNTIVLFLFITLLWKWKSWRWSKEATVIILYTILLAGILAIASPNWGSLLRYKVSFEPYALLLLLGAHPWMRKLDSCSLWGSR